MMTLNPTLRRIVYVALFEILAIGLSTLLLMQLAGGVMQESAPVAVAVSGIAVLWNYVYNTAFEAWETRRSIAARSFLLRAAHSTGFEGGLFLFIVPLYMGWYGVGMAEAIRMEAALLLFFLLYTFAFTWVFDAVFPRRAGYVRG